MEVLDFIKNRRSPYAFSSEPIPENQIRSLFEAARYAPSSMNEQPWAFVLVTRENSQHFNSVLETLDAGNKIWASGAYALVISLARRNFTYKQRENYYALHDTGMAVGNMLAQATSMGLSVHQMGGYDRAALREVCRIGEEYETVAVIALGYKGDDELLPENLKEKIRNPKQRKQLNEFLFRDIPGNPAF